MQPRVVLSKYCGILPAAPWALPSHPSTSCSNRESPLPPREYWAAVHIPPVDSNQDPTEVSFVGKSMPTPRLAIEAAANEAIARLRSAVPYARERGYYYFPSRAAPGGVTSFPAGRIERDPVLANLIQYIIAQEHLNQRVMDYLQSLTDLNPQVAIDRLLRPDPERRIHRLVNPLPPIEEECIPLPETFYQDPTQLWSSVWSAQSKFVTIPSTCVSSGLRT